MFRGYNIAWGVDCWSLYNLPPPPSTKGPWSSSVLHHVMYTLLYYCLLSWIFYSNLERWIRAVWHEMKPQTVEWRKEEGVNFCLMLSCCPPSCYVFFHVFLVCIFRSALYTYDTEEIGCQECTCRIHWNNNSFNMKRVLLLYLYFCVCMSVNQEKSSTCWAGQLLHWTVYIN